MSVPLRSKLMKLCGGECRIGVPGGLGRSSPLSAEEGTLVEMWLAAHLDPNSRVAKAAQ